MEPTRLIFWCDTCEVDHAYEMHEIPCPVFIQQLEHRAEQAQAENDMLTSRIDHLEAELAVLKSSPALTDIPRPTINATAKTIIPEPVGSIPDLIHEPTHHRESLADPRD